MNARIQRLLIAVTVLGIAAMFVWFMRTNGDIERVLGVPRLPDSITNLQMKKVGRSENLGLIAYFEISTKDLRKILQARRYSELKVTSFPRDLVKLFPGIDEWREGRYFFTAEGPPHPSSCTIWTNPELTRAIVIYEAKQ